MKPADAMPAPVAGPLPRVAIVADVKGWAFDNNANNIASMLLDYAITDILYSDELSAEELFRKIFITDDYDHVHFLWKEPYLRFFFDDQFSTTMISGLASVLNLDRTTAIDRIADGMGRVTQTFGVYDHVYLDQISVSSRRAGLVFADGYAVSSNRLFRSYASAYGIDPTVETPDGVDRKLFQPHNLSRLSEADRPWSLAGSATRNGITNPATTRKVSKQSSNRSFGGLSTMASLSWLILPTARSGGDRWRKCQTTTTSLMSYCAPRRWKERRILFWRPWPAGCRSFRPTSALSQRFLDQGSANSSCGGTFRRWRRRSASCVWTALF